MGYNNESYKGVEEGFGVGEWGGITDENAFAEDSKDKTKISGEKCPKNTADE